MKHCAAVVACGFVFTACGDPAPPPPPADTAAPTQQPGADPAAGSAGPSVVQLGGERRAQLREGFPQDLVLVSASGPAHDSLQVRVVIRDARGDTLWVDGWDSLHYFKYDGIEGRSREDIARVVEAHVDTLLHDSRFSARGLPQRLRQSDYSDMMRESVTYHLAELDWRNRASLRASDATPPDAYDRIAAATVAPERVDAVIAELLAAPSYWYYAGGEASYVIGWSAREYAFVRLFSCC